MSLREVLATDVMQETAPEVLAGHGSLDREVRWVHSSEIYEIAPLLSGGELLLTTGLGLAPVDVTARRHYVRDLAAAGVAAVAMEVGRSFASVPKELVEESRRHGFPLIGLNAVAPFVRVTEVINTALVDYSARGQRVPESMTRALNEALIKGSGVADLLVLAARILGCPLVLATAEDAMVAHVGSTSEGAARALLARPAAAVSVSLHGGDWGRLAAGPGATVDHGILEVMLEHTAIALAVALLRTGNPPAGRDRQIARLLADLVEGGRVSEADMDVRARLCGLAVEADVRLTGVAVRAASTAPALRLVDTAAQLLGQPALRAAVEDTVLALITIGANHRDAVGATQHALQEALHRQEPADVLAAVGPVTRRAQGWHSVGGSLRDARTALDLPTHDRPPPSGGRIVATRELELELHLGLASDDRLGRLVDRVLGALVAWDDAHGSALVDTLEVYLVNGSSPTRAAAALFIGRQALYQRIERIEALLGHSIADSRLHRSLLLATAARRMLRRGTAASAAGSAR